MRRSDRRSRQAPRRPGASAWLATCLATLAGGCVSLASLTERADAGRPTLDAAGMDAGTEMDAPIASDTPPVDSGGLSTSDVRHDTSTSSPDSGREFCVVGGPAVIVGDAAMMTETCAGSIAARVFDHATCSCDVTSVTGFLRTASFDSGGSSTSEGGFGAPVGVNTDYLTGGYADIGGTMVVAGTLGVSFGGYLSVGGDAFFAADVSALGRIDVARDLWILGNIPITVGVYVTRDMHQPPGRTLGLFNDIGGRRLTGGFTVPPPCRCGESDIVDVAALVAAAARVNDNPSVGLTAGELDPVIGLGREITLPCGRFYLSGISGVGDITLRVEGRTALFVQGDVNALGVFDIDLGPDGELDLFIAGNLLSIGAGSYGDRARPARTRIYVGGTGDVTLVGASGFVGNVYAPRARITAPGATTVYGSLFGQRIDMPGYLDVRYDRAILDVDVDCPPSTECEPCGGTGCTDDRACIEGMCVGCSSDADCCAPLVCYGDGTCGPLLF
jgi:hypothetical protein